MINLKKNEWNEQNRSHKNENSSIIIMTGLGSKTALNIKSAIRKK